MPSRAGSVPNKIKYLAWKNSGVGKPMKSAISWVNTCGRSTIPTMFNKRSACHAIVQDSSEAPKFSRLRSLTVSRAVTDLPDSL
jgi:hypothetical protein